MGPARTGCSGLESIPREPPAPAGAARVRTGGLPRRDRNQQLTRRSLALFEPRLQLSLDNGSPPLTGWNIGRTLEPRNTPAAAQAPADGPVPSVLYRAALRGVARLAPLAARWSARAAAGRPGQATAVAPFVGWAGEHRDPARPLLLLHAASAGELRQLEPVLRRLRARHPDWQAALTCFSPSGLPVAAALGADIHGLLPWDLPGEMTALLDALRPAALVFGRAELWPELALAAARRGIPLGLAAATLPAESARNRWPARAVLAPVCAALSRVGAVSDEDAARLQRLGVQPAALSVTGDPRADAVLERLEAGPVRPPEPETLVAGSTWPADEDLLLTAFRAVREVHPDARLLLAPHRPTPAHLARLRAAARQHGLPEPVPWRQGAEPAPLRVLDSVGGLARLYRLGVIAYVGGGFGRAGVHSVLEPAAAGLPVIVGPAGTRHPDCVRLNAAAALEWLPRRRAAAALEAWWATLLTDTAWRRRAGASARETVVAGRGAADRTVALIESLVGENTRGGPMARP